MIYGGGALGGVAAYRWKCDVNENAKAPAYGDQYPELDHNEICVGASTVTSRAADQRRRVRHGFEHPRSSTRASTHREIIDEACTRCSRCDAAGEGRLAELLDLMYVGDWVSCYLALQNDVDPGPIDAIFELKVALAAE